MNTVEYVLLLVKLQKLAIEDIGAHTTEQVIAVINRQMENLGGEAYQLEYLRELCFATRDFQKACAAAFDKHVNNGGETTRTNAKQLAQHLARGTDIKQ